MAVKVEFSINTVDLEVKYLYNHLNAAAICLRTTATQFSATTSISTLEPITGRRTIGERFEKAVFGPRDLAA